MELRRAEANADRMLIKAPIDGLAVMQNTRRGTEFAQIQPGDQLFPGMMFMQIVDMSSMVINASVNQVDVDSLRLGQKAKVRFDAYPGSSGSGARRRHRRDDASRRHAGCIRKGHSGYFED